MLTAGKLEVRELSLGSLELVVQRPAEVLAAAGVTVTWLATILDGISASPGFRPSFA